MIERTWNTIVVGGGHAGCEAAAASARCGSRTLLVTMGLNQIGVMSCNPAIGGIGKGQLVKEVDALGGLMGQAADYACIQYRLLNRRKGAAVHGPRGQSDRMLYQRFVQHTLKQTPNLSLAEAEVTRLVIDGGRCVGIQTADGETLSATAVVLTTGTFLRGCIFQGKNRTPAGRVGEAPAVRLSDQLREIASLGRLKTGTPARLKRQTIDFTRLEPQPADDNPHYFSMLTTATQQRQVPCHITHTNPETHEIIRARLATSPACNGTIEGAGPRYCPSIEDKLTRFPDKNSHQIFLEPEGLDSDLVYPNGISTSLDTDAQLAFLRTIRGLERVEVAQYGYAIEYDYLDPRGLDHSLQSENLPGLFLAGQINGSTGYEEAAAQGIMAGINAAGLRHGAEPCVIGRHEGYIGVMVSDLTEKGVSEPYRMFSARAEYRLRLRADNAAERLCPIALAHQCLDPVRAGLFHRRQTAKTAALALLDGLTASPHRLAEAGIKVNQDGVVRSARAWLGFQGIDFAALTRLWPELNTIDSEIQTDIALECHYAHYSSLHDQEIAQFKKHAAMMIPTRIDFTNVACFSHEVRQLLNRDRPKTLAEAARIQGMTPSALTQLMLLIQNNRLVES